jgi:hypothetical protein
MPDFEYNSAIAIYFSDSMHKVVAEYRSTFFEEL